MDIAFLHAQEAGAGRRGWRSGGNGEHVHRRAVGEGVFQNGGQGARQAHTVERRAAVESLLADFHDTPIHIHIFQAGTILERNCPNAVHLVLGAVIGHAAWNVGGGRVLGKSRAGEAIALHLAARNNAVIQLPHAEGQLGTGSQCHKRTHEE